MNNKIIEEVRAVLKCDADFARRVLDNIHLYDDRFSFGSATRAQFNRTMRETAKLLKGD